MTESTRKPTCLLQIRWAIRRDMEEVMRIERRAFQHPWTEEDFIRCLRQRNCIGMVADDSKHVLGYMIYELHRTRLHLLNFAVHPDRRRERIGSAMVAKLVSKASNIDRPRKVVCEIRESNLQALNFFKSQGFRGTKVLRDHYEDCDEDAIQMEYQNHGRATI